MLLEDCYSAWNADIAAVMANICNSQSPHNRVPVLLPFSWQTLGSISAALRQCCKGSCHRTLSCCLSQHLHFPPEGSVTVQGLFYGNHCTNRSNSLGIWRERLCVGSSPHPQFSFLTQALQHVSTLTKNISCKVTKPSPAAVKALYICQTPFNHKIKRGLQHQLTTPESRGPAGRVTGEC